MGELFSFAGMRSFSPFPIGGIPVELAARMEWLFARYSSAVHLKNDSKAEALARSKRWRTLWRTISKIERAVVHILYVAGSFPIQQMPRPNWRYSGPDENEQGSLLRLQREIILHYLLPGDLARMLYICQKSNRSLPPLSIEVLTHILDAYAGTGTVASMPVFNEEEWLAVSLPFTLNAWQPVIESIIRTTIHGRAQAAKHQICVTWPPIRCSTPKATCGRLSCRKIWIWAYAHLSLWPMLQYCIKRIQK
jgi:hypothetical protein